MGHRVRLGATLLLLSACGIYEGTYRSEMEVPLAMWLPATPEDPGHAYARPDLRAALDLYGPLGVVDENIVYSYRPYETREGAARWKERHCVVFAPTDEVLENGEGRWYCYRRLEHEKAQPVLRELRARAEPG